MRLRTIVLAATALLCATPAFAGEAWYFGLGAGWDHLIGPKLSGFGDTGKLKTKDTATVEGTFGYKFPNHFRIEAESGWSRHSNHSFTDASGTSTAGGSLQVRSFLINGIYDFHVTPRLNLSLGAGAGIGRDPFSFSDPSGTSFPTRSQVRFMWQAIGGVSYEASPHLDLFVDYHYRELSGGSGDIAAPVLSARDLREHAVIAGFRWYPWAGPERVAYQEPPAPPTPPAPPPAPPAPAPVKTFIVFFDFNKSNLTPEAVNVVGEAVKAAQTSGAVRVLVTGHTDTVGSDTYNQALSERRAAAVKDQMVADGLPANEITTEGKSFHDPLVATGPNVREPQNRRAVIDLGG